MMDVRATCLQHIYWTMLDCCNLVVTCGVRGGGFSFQQHQLGLRRAAGSCPHVSLRETPVQDWHSALGHRVHRALARGSHSRLRSSDVRREMPARRDQGSWARRMEHEWQVSLEAMVQWRRLKGFIIWEYVELIWNNMRMGKITQWEASKFVIFI